MGKGKIYTIDELSKVLNVSKELISKVISVKLVIAVGVTKDKTPFYSEDNRKQFIYIKSMLDLGYTLGEIQKIVKKVGFPKEIETIRRDLGALLTVGELAGRVKVSIRTLKYWEEKGIIESDMRSEGGFRLYSESYVYLCKLILDLQLFGYSLNQIRAISDHFREFLLISNDLELFTKELTKKKIEYMNSEIISLKSKMTLFKEGISRWEDLLSKKLKDLNSIKKKNDKRISSEKEMKNDLPENV